MSTRKLGVGMVVTAMALAACGGGDGGPDADGSEIPVLVPTAASTGPVPEVSDAVSTLGFLGDLGRLHSHPVTVVVGPDGGSIALDDGSTIEVPPASFPEPTELEVVVVDLLFDQYLASPPQATIYALSTSRAVTLGAPIVLESPVPASQVVVEELVNGEWREVDVPAGPTTRIPFGHFSQQVRSIIPRGEFPLSDSERGFMTAREMEAEDDARAEDFATSEWCLELMSHLFHYEWDERTSMASMFAWALCNKKLGSIKELGEAESQDKIFSEDCVDANTEAANVLDEIQRCVEPVTDGDQAEEPVGDLAEDAGSDSDTDDSSETSTTDSVPPAASEPPTSPDPDSESQATLSESARVFQGTADISLTVKSMQNVGGEVEGCTVDLSVGSEFALHQDGTVTLLFTDWPMHSGHTEGNPISRQWIYCFAPAAEETWGNGKTGPNRRIYSTTWIGVGDSVAWSAIEIGTIGSIRVDVNDTQPKAQAVGHATLSIDMDVLGLDLSITETIEDYQVYVIDFTLDEVP